MGTSSSVMPSPGVLPGRMRTKLPAGLVPVAAVVGVVLTKDAVRKGARL